MEESKRHKLLRSRRWPGRLNKVILLLAIVGLVGGVYLLLLATTPRLPILGRVEPLEVKSLGGPKEDRVYIPKLGINVALLAGGPEVLNQAAWHRLPERGDPEKGGNFIISAHRFSLGSTPAQTRQKSPFYHIDKLKVGDQIVVDFHSKRYAYEILERKSVKPTQIEIEAASQVPKLTLYSCSLKGEADGREVFIAQPLGEMKNDRADSLSLLSSSI